MIERKNPCGSATSRIVNLFRPLSREDKSKKIIHELKQHLAAINNEIASFSGSPDIHSALREAYSHNDGLDCMDALRDKINQLHQQHRLTISDCERCGEATCQCCWISYFVIMICAQIITVLAKQPPMTIPLDVKVIPDYDDPRNENSPFKSLAKAVSDYSAWYKTIKHFTDELMDATRFQTECERIKKEFFDNHSLQHIPSP